MSSKIKTEFWLKRSPFAGAWVYQGRHQQIGGTILDFNVLLRPQRHDGEQYYEVILDAHNVALKMQENGRLGASGARPELAMAKLVSIMRRCADAIETALREGVEVPSVVVLDNAEQLCSPLPVSSMSMEDPLV